MSSFRLKLRFTASPALALLMTSCMLVGRNYTSPSAITPDSWNQSLSADLNSGSSSLEKWWTRFNDPTLNRLIKTARESNRDLAIAYERINQARAARGVARSQLFPQLDFNGGVSRNRISENIGNPGGGKTSDFWTTGIDAGWELDFFGGVRRAVESADASVEGTEELYRDTMVSLLAEVAFAYIQIRTLDERIRLASRNIKNQADSVQLTQDRADAGLAPDLDVSQAQTNLATTEAAIPSLRNQRDIALNRLAVLIGRYPSAAESFIGSAKGIPTPNKSASVGIPSDLVRSRPDIRAAERNLAAQTARIGVAEADLFPRFTLSGTFQLQSLAFSSLPESNSRNYAFGPTFRWNIFNAGRIKSQIAIEESLTKQAYLNYENTVLKGVAEVEDALSSVRNERDRYDALDKAVTATEKTVELVKSNYKEGLTDFQNVLDAERTIFANEDALAVSQGQIAAAYVSLFKALGGGTRMRSAKSAETP
ncbi:efflux transporter outer membrane subunit [Haloferula sp. A504]|uniref:efflux transporter outer membrane subunit n=1 Tax=Haloferula sp. A504 TaxID=3373601 RepID=UPI0031CA2CE6|nr:efflux transporter outer membrane subunit [Verrucomicrobiaceae bacterium E54]